MTTPTTSELAARVRAAFENLGQALAEVLNHLAPQGANYNPWPPETQTDQTGGETDQTGGETGEEGQEISLDQIRATLADLSAQGKTKQIKKALTKLGATKLSELNPTQYPQLLQTLQTGD